MYNTTHRQKPQVSDTTTTPGGESRRAAQKRHRVAVTFWVLGLIIFVISCLIIHFHPQPYPFDLAATQTVQSLHPWPWVNSVIEFPSTLNDPLPSIVALGVWFFAMLLIGLAFRSKGRSPARWLLSAVFLLLTVMCSAGLNVVIDDLVARPRPDPHTEPIHVYTPIVPFPTYPSGHTEHDVAFYGFLLYLSFTRPVREWRYRWLLIPLQLYALFDILAIGYSRVLEGDHWLTDVLGGYLEGALYLLFFIFLYRWTTDLLAQRRARKIAKHPSMAHNG